MAQAASEPGELETPWVFIDTEGFRSAGLEWGSRLWVSFAEVCAARELRPLITSVTKREVSNRLREALREAIAAGQKHRSVFNQFGLSVEATLSAEGALAKLTDNFDTFLAGCRFVDVPLTALPTDIFDDYFAAVPPFGSGKKKAEFPDAFVLHSLRNWADNTGNSLYVVSKDPDLAAFCATDPRFLLLPKVEEVVSRALAKRELVTNLTTFLNNSTTFLSRVESQLSDYQASSRYGQVLGIEFSDVEVSDVYVVEREGDDFYLEVEMDCAVSVDIEDSDMEMVMDRDGEPDWEMAFRQERIIGQGRFMIECHVQKIADQAFDVVNWNFSGSDLEFRSSSRSPIGRITFTRR